MNKYIYMVILMITGMTYAQAQRMLPGQKGMEINAGALSYKSPGSNYYINTAMIVNGRNGNYQLWALEYAYQQYDYKDRHIAHDTFTAEGGYGFFLLGDSRKNIMLNGVLTGVAGYETINRGKTTLYDGAKVLHEDSFIYGVSGRLRLETYLADRFVLLTQGRTKFLWGTTLDKFRPSAGFGLRFNF